MTFIAEYAPDKRRGFLGSRLEFGTLTGYAIGAIIVTVISTVLPDDAVLSWGWRIPFFVALPLGIVGVYLRLKLEGTPAYQKLQQETDAKEREHKAGTEFKDILKLWPFMVVCGGLVLVWNVTNYMLTSYSATMPSTLPTLFPTKVRAGSLSIAFSISVSLFGGTTSLVVGGLVGLTGDLNWPSYYLIIAGVIGAVAIFFTKESARKPLQGSHPSVGTEEQARTGHLRATFSLSPVDGSAE